MIDPRSIHSLDQLSGVLREVADRLATYRQRLLDGGVPEDEAWALVQRMEERIMGPILDSLEGEDE